CFHAAVAPFVKSAPRPASPTRPKASANPLTPWYNCSNPDDVDLIASSTALSAPTTASLPVSVNWTWSWAAVIANWKNPGRARSNKTAALRGVFAILNLFYHGYGLVRYGQVSVNVAW